MVQPHSHNCPTCKKDFTGRLNKKFCCDDCKTSFNNTKASNLNKELTDNKILKKNYLILKELYPDSLGEEPVEIKKMYMKGFDFMAPNRKVKTHKNGFECYIINSYAFRTLNNNPTQQLIIYKTEELDKL